VESAVIEIDITHH